MTRDSLRTSDPALAAALDQVRPPQLGPGFADRVVAQASRRVPSALHRSAGRRWTRGRGLTIGAAALALTSAAAAGIGAFEPIGVRVPAMERLVERVTGKPPVPVKKSPPAKVAPSKKAEAPRAETQAKPAEAAMALDPRRERIAQAVANRVDRRIARRDRLGLPVPDAARDPDWRPSPQRAARNPERAALVQRVQEIRGSRAAAQVPRSSNSPGAAPAQTAPASVERLAGDWPGLGWRARLAAMRSLNADDRRAVFERLGPKDRAELLRLREGRGLGILMERRMERRAQRRAREGFGRDPR